MIKVYKFTTSTCSVCKMIEPHWEALKTDLPNVLFEEYVVDTCTGGTEYIKKFNIKAAPSIVITNDAGDVLKVLTGFHNKRDLKKEISSFM